MVAAHETTFSGIKDYLGISHSLGSIFTKQIPEQIFSEIIYIYIRVVDLRSGFRTNCWQDSLFLIKLSPSVTMFPIPQNRPPGGGSGNRGYAQSAMPERCFTLVDAQSTPNHSQASQIGFASI